MLAVLGRIAVDKFVVWGITMTIESRNLVRYNNMKSWKITIRKDYKRTKTRCRVLV